jgi:hypothetical protein
MWEKRELGIRDRNLAAGPSGEMGYDLSLCKIGINERGRQQDQGTYQEQKDSDASQHQNSYLLA